MTIRLDATLGPVFVNDNGQEEVVFATQPVQEQAKEQPEAKRRYQVYVNGQYQFASSSMCGDRVRLLLAAGLTPTIRDSETGVWYAPETR